MKSGLNFLEPSGPPQACKGTALPLPLNKSFRLHITHSFIIIIIIIIIVLYKCMRHQAHHKGTESQ